LIYLTISCFVSHVRSAIILHTQCAVRLNYLFHINKWLTNYNGLETIPVSSEFPEKKIVECKLIIDNSFNFKNSKKSNIPEQVYFLLFAVNIVNNSGGSHCVVYDAIVVYTYYMPI